MELCNPDLKRQERKGDHSRDRCTPPPFRQHTHTLSLFLSSYSHIHTHAHTPSLFSPPPTNTHINEGQKRCLTKKKTKRKLSATRVHNRFASLHDGYMKKNVKSVTANTMYSGLFYEKGTQDSEHIFFLTYEL